MQKKGENFKNICLSFFAIAAIDNFLAHTDLPILRQFLPSEDAVAESAARLFCVFIEAFLEFDWRAIEIFVAKDGEPEMPFAPGPGPGGRNSEIYSFQRS